MDGGADDGGGDGGGGGGNGVDGVGEERVGEAGSTWSTLQHELAADGRTPEVDSPWWWFAAFACWRRGLNGDGNAATGGGAGGA